MNQVEPMSTSYIYELAIEHYLANHFGRKYALSQIERIRKRAQIEGVWLLYPCARELQLLKE